ncbi:MAG TPA: VOC family protein [Leptolyngbyaceae cyanobacterium]
MILQCHSAIVTLATSDINKLIIFYTQLLQQEPVNYIPNVYAEFDLPGLRLGIFRPKESELSEFQNSGQSTIGLCLEVNDLENAIAHFTKLGYPPPGQIITASHGREIYAYDPAGNRLILHQSKTQVKSENPSDKLEKNKR